MTTGGELLRALRQRREGRKRKLTIEQVAEQSGITYRALWNIEHGNTAKPNKAVLDSILNTLDAFLPITIEQRNEVLMAFKYPPLLTPPTDVERTRVAVEWQNEYRHLTQPAYLVDFTQRLLAWNRYAPRILGMEYNDPRLRKLKGITIFDLAFNSDFIAASRITNGAEFLPNMIQVIKAEMEPFSDTNWYKELIDETSTKYPLFKSIWNSLPSNLPMVRLRTMGPVQVQHPDGKILKFHLMGVDFVNDPRFRIVQYHPADVTTLSEWNKWIDLNDEI